MDKQRRFCDNCGKENPVGVKFCIYCGYPLAETVQNEVVSNNEADVKYCDNCGKENTEAVKFCIYCGHPMTETMQNGVVSNNEAYDRYCDNCGSPVSENDDFCTNCGYQLSQTCAFNPNSNIPKKKTNKTLRVLLVTLLALLLIVICGVIIFPDLVEAIDLDSLIGTKESSGFSYTTGANQTNPTTTWNTESDIDEVSSKTTTRNLSVGEMFTFGKYKQGKYGGVEPIKWQVLDIKDGKALVISEKLLDYIPYNEEEKSVTWENCSLRKWMNDDFYNIAFSSNEQKEIALVTNVNPDNPNFGTNGGNDTQDRIFALSIDEAKKYFPSDKSRIAYTTEYAHSKGEDYENGAEVWWLRSPGNYGYYARYVGSAGDAKYGMKVNHNGVAVRPAFWLVL